jgi:pimeloyl-ACP methyl ester carboxylesterase
MARNEARRGIGVGTVALGAAILAAGTALQVNAAARRAERAHPPRGRFVEVAGVRLHYLEAGPEAAQGAGPAVVLLHGNGVTAEDWAASGVLGRLAARRRVVAFDRPGYGYSDRPRGITWSPEAQAALFAQAFARLGLGRPVVVGHSWGTLVAAALGLDHRGSVEGIVLVSGYHYPTARVDVVAFSPPAVPVLGDVLRYTAAPLTGRLIGPALVRKMFAPQPVPPAFAAAVPLPIMLRPWQIRAAAEDAATMTPRAAAVADRYGELAGLPVTIMAGEADGIVDPARHSGRLHDDVPGSVLRLVPGVGHMVHHAVPGLVAEAVEAMGLAPATLPEPADALP